MNVTKIILNRCQIFHLKCTKFNFGGDSKIPLGTLQHSPRYPSWIFGKRKGKKDEIGREEERKGKGEGKREGAGRKR